MQALRHAARTRVHKPSDTQPVHACTSTWTCSPYTRAQHSDTEHIHACTALRHAACTRMHSTQTPSPYTRAQALRHAAHTRVHSTQTRSPYTRAQHSDTARTRVHTHPSPHVHTHTSSDIHVLVHTQQLPTGGVGLSRDGGRCVPTHLVILGWVHGGVAPLKRGLGLLQQGAPVLGVVGCGGFSPLSGTAALARPCVPLPRHPGWSRHCPSVDQNRPPPSGQVPLASRQLPRRGRRPVGVRVSSRGHHPRISRPSAGSLGQLPPWATVSQPQGRRQQAASRPHLTHPPLPPRNPVCLGPGPGGQASPLSMLRAQGSSSQSSLSPQLDWAFQVLAKPAPVASTSPPAVLKSSPSRPLKFPQRPEGPGQGWERRGPQRPDGGREGEPGGATHPALGPGPPGPASGRAA